MQIYEQYWSYTAAFTDLFGTKAVTSLKICVDFLDVHANDLYTKELYEELQTEIKAVLQIDYISIRKAVNQFVKLGFLKPLLAGYPSETREFLMASSNAKRKSILSKIVYKYANFDNSMTSPIYGGKRQINFVLKTLEEIGHISEKELTAMMLVDINKYPNGYLTPIELSQYYRSADANGFIARKYNQISHLKNLLGKLDDLISCDGTIYYETDAKNLFGENLEHKKVIKEPYLQRVYNCELIDESKSTLGKSKAESMIVGTQSQALVPVHIKPIIESNIITKRAVSFEQQIAMLKLLAQNEINYLSSEGEFENKIKHLIIKEPELTIDSRLADSLCAIDNENFKCFIPGYTDKKICEIGKMLLMKGEEAIALKRSITEHIMANITSILDYE